MLSDLCSVDSGYLSDGSTANNFTKRDGYKCFQLCCNFYFTLAAYS